MFSRAVGRDGRCKQITLARAPSVSATLGLPPLSACVLSCIYCLGSRLLCRELSEAGPGLHVPPRSKPLRLRHSGSPQRCRLGWVCILCLSQVQVAQVFGEHGCCDLLPLPSLLLFSGCTTGTSSQADDDCPEPQEVLVSKEACLQFDS